MSLGRHAAGCHHRMHASSTTVRLHRRRTAARLADGHAWSESLSSSRRTAGHRHPRQEQRQPLCSLLGTNQKLDGNTPDTELVELLCSYRNSTITLLCTVTASRQEQQKLRHEASTSKNGLSGHDTTNTTLGKIKTSKLSQRVKEISHKSYTAILWSIDFWSRHINFLYGYPVSNWGHVPTFQFK